MNTLTTLCTIVLLIATIGHQSSGREPEAIQQIYFDIGKTSCDSDEADYKAFYDAVRYNVTHNASYDYIYPDDNGKSNN